MQLAGIAIGLLGGAAIGVAAAVVVARILRRETDANYDVAVQGAVAQLAAERDAMVQAAVDSLAVSAADRLGVHSQATIETVLSLAGDQLGARADAASRELDLRNVTIEQQISGMNDELRQVRSLVADLQKDKAEQHGQLVQGLENALKVSESLMSTTQSLREALSNSRARGQWGERMAEDVLRAAGFVEGVNYRRQNSIDGGRPDLTFLLPRDRVLHMDVKFPIDNYMRHLEATTDVERDVATKAFTRDVRARVKELTTRHYLDADTTVGYVLLFIPNESVYGFIHEHDAALLDYALSQKVVPCSPVTLFAVLAVVRQSVEQFLVERTSDEILECLSGFSKQWENFSTGFEKLGKQFGTAQRTYDELAGTRRNQLQRQLDRVDRLRTDRGLGEVSMPVSTVDERDVPKLRELSPPDDINDLDDYDDERGESDDCDHITAVGESFAKPRTTGTHRVPRLRPIRGR